jgi:hypothetical protein
MSAGSIGFVRKKLATLLPILLAAVHAAGQTTREAGSSAVVSTTADQYLAGPDRSLVSLGVGRKDGLAVGDRFWLFSQGGISGTGVIFLVTEAQCVGRLTFTSKQLAAKQPAAVLRAQALPSLRRAMDAEVCIRGRVLRVPPARRTAWLDFGRKSGLQQGDPVLVRRYKIPISRGRLEIVDEEVSLAELHPVVGNATPEPDDEAVIWPASGTDVRVRLNSTVLDVAPGREGRMITIVGTAEDGLVENRLVDLYREGRLIGVAAIRDVDNPISDAVLIDPASRGAPEVGDTALVRLRPGRPPRPLSAVIFRIANDYCLLAAGESDGVQVNEKFVVYGQQPGDPTATREVAELTVRTVKVDYSGAQIRPLVADGTQVKVWDMAERRLAVPVPKRAVVGQISQTHNDSRTLIASLDSGSGLTAGQLLYWVPPQTAEHQPGAGVIVSLADGRAIIYVPPAWGSLPDAQGSRVEALLDQN